MQQLTQTRPDNCWQTCVAMLLNCSAESLPLQHEFANRDQYAKALRVYLDKHHGITYVEVSSEMFTALNAQGVYHLLIGETVRTTPNHDVWHAIVGLSGEPHWDVHPSRAGLTKIHAWGLLTPTPEGWRSTWKDAACSCGGCKAESTTV